MKIILIIHSGFRVQSPHEGAAMWNSLVPVLVFDSANRRIVVANDAAAALFKVSPSEMVGESVDHCVIREERERLNESIGTSEPRWGDVGLWQCLARDGTRFMAEVRFHQMLHEGKLVHIVLATAVVQVASARSVAAGSYDSLPKRA
jgi:PAS domain-containing protein